MTTNKSQTCPTCEGGGMQYMDKVCPDCGGTGKQIWPPDYQGNTEVDCPPCHGTGRIEATDTPMGVSQWKAHGIKYGYWDFFAKNLCPGFTCGCLPVHNSKGEHDAARTTEDMDELEQRLREIDIHYGWVSKTPKVAGRGVTHLVNGDLDKVLALITASNQEAVAQARREGAKEFVSMLLNGMYKQGGLTVSNHEISSMLVEYLAALSATDDGEER